MAFLALLGPTGSGKTSLSLEVAKCLDVEIISMDSRQIYRGMDIGTGKITEAERGRVPHFGLDLRDPSESYSAGQFSRDARGWIEAIEGRGRIPFLVGGTGFFLRALVEPMFAEPPLDPVRLDALRKYLNQLPVEALKGFLEILDPERGTGVFQGDPQRMTRAVEVALLTGRSLSWWHREGSPAETPLDGIVLVLDLPRDLLYDRINRRVERMVEEGLVEEVQSLLRAGFGPEDPGMTGAGYREIVSHLRGEISLDEAKALIQQSHRRYARRQITWNRHQLPQGTVFLDGTLERSSLAEAALAAWERWKQGLGRESTESMDSTSGALDDG